jgi:hypothetical protein
VICIAAACGQEAVERGNIGVLQPVVRTVDWGHKYGVLQLVVRPVDRGRLGVLQPVVRTVDTER